jgi:hypothetical protein
MMDPLNKTYKEAPNNLNPEELLLLKEEFLSLKEEVSNAKEYLEEISKENTWLQNLFQSLMDKFEQYVKTLNIPTEVADLIINKYRETISEKILVTLRQGEAKPDSTLELPDKVELYFERPDKKEDAYRFLIRVWGKYLDAGVLYQNDLKKLDSKLHKAVDNACRLKKEKFATIVPTKSDKINKELEFAENAYKNLDRITVNFRRRRRRERKMP